MKNIPIQVKGGRRDTAAHHCPPSWSLRHLDGLPGRKAVQRSFFRLILIQGAAVNGASWMTSEMCLRDARFGSRAMLRALPQSSNQSRLPTPALRSGTAGRVVAMWQGKLVVAGTISVFGKTLRNTGPRTNSLQWPSETERAASFREQPGQTKDCTTGYGG